MNKFIVLQKTLSINMVKQEKKFADIVLSTFSVANMYQLDFQITNH